MKDLVEKGAFEFEINGRKKRKIVTYKENSEGNKLRKIHEKILLQLEKVPSSNKSYAYKKGKSTKEALIEHFNSNLFIRFDIRNYFESINQQKLVAVAKDILEDNSVDAESLLLCFYNGHLPLGFVSSPRISDIYLYKFDLIIEEYINLHRELHYSRYCDDILISTEDTNFGSLHTLFYFMKKELEKLDLQINEEKTREFNLIDKHKAVSFLGLNLSKKDGESRITISKKFILKIIDLLKEAYFYKEFIDSTFPFLKEKYRVLKYNKRNNIVDPQLEEELEKKHSLYLEYKTCLSYLVPKIKSYIGYLKHNSLVSYKKFLKKHFNVFQFNWGKVWL